MDREIRLLIVDDSSYNRKAIAGFFKSYPRVRIVGKAADGQEGLQMALNEDPTVVTLDLEMPRIDGFAFLRLLMSSRPTPVIVISSHANKENVFRALELGALDFVAKPSTFISPEIKEIKSEVVQKVLAAGRYNANALRALSTSAPVTGMHVVPKLGRDDETPVPSASAEKIIAIGASTGGPASLTNIISSLPEDLDAGIVISQHMPPQFTATFAKRLNKLSRLSVMELQRSEIIQRGRVYVAPGDGDLVVTRTESGFRAERKSPLEESSYTPCVDRMFQTAAQAVGENLLAVVLTGMGNDGTAGCREVYASGGSIVVESEETAVVYGMPAAVVQAGIPARSRPLHLIANKIITFAK